MSANEKPTPCKGCRALLRFIKSPKGRRIPVNSEAATTIELRPARDGEQTAKIVTAEGLVFTGPAANGAPSSDVERRTGLRSHWEVCPDAARFRRGGAA